MTETEHQPKSPEEITPRAIEPKIYVASLSDYNNGDLVGTWIDAAQPADDLHDEITEMLKRSHQPNPEEWAIHDYEGFGAFAVNEYEQIKTVSLIAQGIECHGSVFAHYVNTIGTADHEALDKFEDAYLGSWESRSEYARSLLEDMGLDVERIGPSWLQEFITLDLEGVAEAAMLDFETAEDEHGIHVFEASL